MARRRGRLVTLQGRLVDGLPITGVSIRERVHCECGDKDCGCAATCPALACYQWGSIDAGDLEYLCYRCAARMVERGTGPARPPSLTVIPVEPDVEGSDE